MRFLFSFLVLSFFLISCKDQHEIDLKNKAIQERNIANSKIIEHEKNLELKSLELNRLTNEIKNLNQTIEQLKTENRNLKLTPRFFFDEAISVYTKSTSNEGDEKALTAFQIIIDRFPDDPLYEAAQVKIKEIQKRIKDRAAKLKKDQAKVRNLIKLCESKTRAAEATEKQHVAFNMFGQLNMNLVMLGQRRSEALQSEASAAQEKAKLLLKDVPDPNDELSNAIDRCTNFI